MENSLKVTDKIIGIFTNLDLPEVREAKILLREKYGSIMVPDVHVSYLINTIPEYNLEPFQKELSKLIQNKDKFTITIKDITSKDTFLSLPVESDNVLLIHKELLVLANKYRDGYLREKDIQRYKEGKYSEQEFETIKKYGFKYVLDNFHPHISLGSASRDDLVIVMSRLRRLLKKIVDKRIEIDNITAFYHLTSEDHADSKVVWSKDYKLK